MAAKRTGRKKKTKAKQPTGAEVPELRALLACDAAAREPASSKITLYGIFQSVRLKQNEGFDFAIYARVSGGKGHHTFSIGVKEPGKAHIRAFAKSDQDIDFGATTDVEAVVKCLQARFPAGVNEIYVLIDEKPIGKPCPVEVEIHDNGGN